MNGATDVGTGFAADVTTEADDGEQDQVAAGAAEARLLRELCHDLIEPAASIKLLALAAVGDARQDPSVTDRLRLIADEAGRIADICGQVLDRPRRIDPVRLDVVAADAVASARLRYRGAIDAVISPVTLQIHPAVIVRILNNLLTNACRAAGPGGYVRLMVTLGEDGARLSVANSGDGFRQPTAHTSLGLEIIGSLVLGCAGTVQLGTSDLGGPCMVVTLPCPPQPAPPADERDRVLVGSPGTGPKDEGQPA